ncbi:protein ECT2 isoform X3 [Nilaparvata lugens]|nr:protein ECT2 isoform X3 [Nilaparvata lugens]XP_039297577.1 protein ECT2 isoform X3 [Nilaparvata lugens]XP_039297578.1 protein ECT2 isoform X3 [Nilaparvata lugens]XP_039297579.1 protein ECT2 isoform X3 [Nilaparvata lugens]XP_039297580.1 protein ECT2 isoform X3 [Nilaparvata lugens]XP_039297581.1 protein ECT2 isoform X3 [Nilaparvata lugens]
MDGFNCFISIKEKEQVKHLMKLIRSMGGSVRAKLSEAMYFIAETTLASGYLYCNTFNIPTLSPQWVEYMWNNRHTPAFKCDTITFKFFKMKPFRGLYVAFLHFPPDERSHIELLEQNQGVLVESQNPLCTHVVIDDFSLSEQFSDFGEKRTQVKLVHAEWFWTCIQYEARVSEGDFLFSTESDENATAQQTPRLFKSKNSLNWCELMIDPSLRFSLDSSQLLDEFRSGQGDCCSNSKCQSSHDFILEELSLTEKNYLDVLEAIKLIKEKAENEIQIGGPMINGTQSKQIFLNTQELLTLHKNMLEDIEKACRENKGKKAFSAFSKYSDELKTQYPKFCNGFEEARKTIRNLSVSNPRFRALLEISKNKPESGRQTLQELMHRPLQRLGSVTLLIKEVLGRTDQDCQHRNALEEGLQSVEAALRLMNEELIETEKLTSVFRVYTSIKNCPVTLVSSHRCLRVTFFSQEITGNISMPGDYLAFHLFSDVLEISRLKKKIAIATLKNKRKEENTAKTEDEVLYKHLQILPLHKIRKVVDVIDNNDVKDTYGLVIRETVVKDSVWCFRYMSDSENKLSKTDLVIFIAKCLARYECSGDFDKYWVALKPHEVDDRLKTSLVPLQSRVKKLLNSVTDHLSPSSSKIAKLSTIDSPK